ncbi:unnamed protein product [Paramecium octaurelia]|uniref:RING-type domain-containing protein n=1 Tax=Paramecium octaurelia TaxID=43137 RepID=A0A8S1T3Q3_PAROT|nr:unnamed protein product [Paramecium octaurelia]
MNTGKGLFDIFNYKLNYLHFIIDQQIQQQKKNQQIKRTKNLRMIQIVEERSEQQQQQQYEIDGVSQRIWEEVANQYRQEIQSLQLQLWQNSVDKMFQKSNGVPKKYLQKLKMMKMGKSNRQCSICCNQFQKDELIIQLPCKHIYHKSCVDSWLQSSTKCPNCRSDVLEALKNQEK